MYLFLSQNNTFQAVIATDGVNSFSIFNYNKIEWTYGTASNIPAQVRDQLENNTYKHNALKFSSSLLSWLLQISADVNIWWIFSFLIFLTYSF